MKERDGCLMLIRATCCCCCCWGEPGSYLDKRETMTLQRGATFWTQTLQSRIDNTAWNIILVQENIDKYDNQSQDHFYIIGIMHLGRCSVTNCESQRNAKIVLHGSAYCVMVDLLSSLCGFACYYCRPLDNLCLVRLSEPTYFDRARII